MAKKETEIETITKTGWVTVKRKTMFPYLYTSRPKAEQACITGEVVMRGTLTAELPAKRTKARK